MHIVKKSLRTDPCFTGRWKKPGKKKTSRLQKSSLLKKLNALRSRLSARIRRVSNETDQLQSRVNQLEVRVNQLAAEVNALVAPTQSARALLQARTGTTATIETDAGSISGTIVAVGIDFVQILEPTGDIDFIPLSSITAII